MLNYPLFVASILTNEPKLVESVINVSKGNKYYENIKKYYLVDVGLRNDRLNYKQLEQTHLMENNIFNEERSGLFTIHF